MTSLYTTDRPLHLSNCNRQFSVLSSPIGLNSLERTKWTWRHCDGVCFDVDSTVCQDEAIDELATHLGCGELVVQATRKAMNDCSLLSFRTALTTRLDLMRPSRSQFFNYVRTHEPKLTVGIRELVRELKQLNVELFLVSGGFRPLVLGVAKVLDIRQDHVFANELLFDEHGSYAGFDQSELTSDSGSPSVGKAAVCSLIKKKYNLQHLVMVGDGTTDMEACPPADAFVGFGGNQARHNVQTEAEWFVLSFDELTGELRKRGHNPQ